MEWWPSWEKKISFFIKKKSLSSQKQGCHAKIEQHFKNMVQAITKCERNEGRGIPEITRKDKEGGEESK